MNKEKMKGIVIGLTLSILLFTSVMAIASGNGAQGQFTGDMPPLTVGIGTMTEMLDLPVDDDSNNSNTVCVDSSDSLDYSSSAGFVDDMDPLDHDSYDSSTVYVDSSSSHVNDSHADFADDMDTLEHDLNAHTTYVSDSNPQEWLAPPSNIRWSATEPGVVVWDEVSNATHYEMHLFHNDTLVHIHEGTASVFSSKFGSPGDIILNGDLETGAYTFVVRSGYHTDNTRLYGDWSELSPVYYYDRPSDSLPAPQNLSWDLDDPSSLTWTSAPGTRTYSFEVSKNGITEFGTSYVPAPLSSYNFWTFEPGIEYQVRIRAYSSDIGVAGNSEWSPITQLRR